MKPIAVMLMLGLTACAKQAGSDTGQQPPSNSVIAQATSAPQSPMPGKGATEMKLMPIPKDKAELARLVASGYTIHEDHMHPPGVKSCPFDKNGGSVIQ